MAGFTVSALPEYIEQNKSELIHAVVMGAPSLTELNYHLVEGVKHKEVLNFGSTGAEFQAGDTCAFNASGSTSFSQVTLTATAIKVQDQYCTKDLEEKYLQKYLKPGVGKQDSSMPLEQFLTENINKNLAANMEKAVWQGDTTNHVFSTTLKQFNGWIQTLDAGSPVQATAAASITTSNVRTVIEEIYTLIPAKLLATDKHPTLFVGWDTFRSLVTKLTTDNLYHYTTDGATKKGELMYPGLDLKVKALHGLTNITGTTTAYKDRMICTYEDNLVYVTDLKNDFEDWDLWFSKDDRVWKMSVNWKSGCAWKFTEDVVTFKRTGA